MVFNSFNKGVEKIIDLLSYDFYVIIKDNSLKCKCIDSTSKQANLSCKQCLGLGSKIKIKKISGYQSDDKTTIRTSENSESVSSLIYYTKAKQEINAEAIIVDHGQAYVVNRAERFKSSNNNIIYKKLYCTPKKSMPKVFLKNFYDIVTK